MFKKVIIFHYHLLPGGVTQVISQSIRSVFLHIPEVQEILILTGRKENADIVVSRLIDDHKKHQPSPELTMAWKTIPEFGYLPEEMATEETYAAIKKKLAAFAGESLWWVHNYHIGKNPLFTRALIETAETESNQRMLFHIHDFPECSRFSNLAFLSSHCPPPLYPNLPNLRYCVINSRDKDILISAGMAEEKVFLLHDPVPMAAPSGVDPDGARKIVDAYGKKEGTRYQPGGRLLFYPVRTIRRKNVLEAILLTTLLHDTANLIVTLPGVSVTEKPYSDLVQSCFSKGLVSGLFGTGRTQGAPGFNEFTAAAHMVVSSSVQEGFGYLFLNALQWEVPLVSRYLDILKGIEKIFTGYPHNFYSRISVPISKKERLLLKDQYALRLKGLTGFLNSEILEQLETEIEGLVGGDSVDYSYLSPHDQAGVIQKTENISYRNEVQDLNKNVVDSVEFLYENEGNTSSPLEVEMKFGLEAFANGLKVIFDSFSTHSNGTRGKAGDQNTIIRNFAAMENIRLLYE